MDNDADRPIIFFIQMRVFVKNVNIKPTIFCYGFVALHDYLLILLSTTFFLLLNLLCALAYKVFSIRLEL